MDLIWPIARLVIIILMVLLSIGMVVTILLQDGNSGNVSALSGQSDTYFNKNKEKTLAGALKRLTVIFSVALIVLSISFFLTIFANHWDLELLWKS